MYADYEDITSRINEPPLWYSENGVPRYGDFHPSKLGVYDKFAILVQIECQDCSQMFQVAWGMPRYTFPMIFEGDKQDKDEPEVEESKVYIRLWNLQRMCEEFHYGDAPRHGCVGDTMNSIPHRIVEAWERGGNLGLEWKRIPEHEQEI